MTFMARGLHKTASEDLMDFLMSSIIADIVSGIHCRCDAGYLCTVSLRLRAATKKMVKRVRQTQVSIYCRCKVEHSSWNRSETSRDSVFSPLNLK